MIGHFAEVCNGSSLRVKAYKTKVMVLEGEE